MAGGESAGAKAAIDEELGRFEAFQLAGVTGADAAEAPDTAE